MGNALRVFLRDVRRIAKTPAAWVVVLALMVLPSLYTWFNVAAFWDPYDNTANMKICVVNEDEGCEDRTLGTLDLGSQVVQNLQKNDQLGWEFVDREAAMDEVCAGRAYAAFVIPSDFSANIATIVSDHFIQPQLEYYVNEKSGPVAPKITDTGANSLDTTINDEFFSTVSSTVVKSLDESLDESALQLAQAKSKAAGGIDDALLDIKDARAAISDLAASAEDARAKSQTAKATLQDAKRHLDQLSEMLGDASSLAGEASSGLITVTGEISPALDETSALLSKASSETTLAIAQSAAAVEAAKAAIGVPVDPDSDLGKLNEALDKTAADLAATADPVNGLVQEALDEADGFRAVLARETVPVISSSLAQVAVVSADLSTAVSNQKLLIDQVGLILDQLDDTLGTSGGALGKTDKLLADLSDDLSLVRSDISALGMSSALDDIIGEDGIDSEKVAEFMMSPTQVKSEVLYPVDHYGSAMAPLFINLTLWIGVFMLMVIMRIEVDDEGIEKLTITQRYFGRGFLLAVIVSVQACVCCAGCLALGVQTVNAPLMFLTAVIASLAYLSIQYTLSSTLQHVGKGICIILVFVQIPGATGLYPIEMTPDFFHAVYPLFPFTYGINAMREAICGFYDGQWLQNIGMLAGFGLAFVTIGVIARPYLTNLNRMFARQIQESDIINGESVELPARRYRLSQIVRTLTEREEYRTVIGGQASRFVALYPLLKQIAIVVSITVPVFVTTVLLLLLADKVIILTGWLVWLAITVAFFIIVEYAYDNISHQLSLETMSDEEVRALYMGRDTLTRVRPVARLFDGGAFNFASGASDEDEGGVPDDASDSVEGDASDSVEGDAADSREGDAAYAEADDAADSSEGDAADSGSGDDAIAADPEKGGDGR